MKLTMKEVQSKMSAAWGRRAVVVPYRICGNRYRFAVTDHGEYWIPLDASWVGGRQVFEPSGQPWPEPKQTTWADAVHAASQLAMGYFLDQGGYPLCLLANFGQKPLGVRRFVHTPQAGESS